MAARDDAIPLARFLRRHLAENVHADVIDAKDLAAQVRADFPAYSTAEIEKMIIALGAELGVAVLLEKR